MPIHDQLYRRYKGCCYYCGVKTLKKIKSQEDLPLLATRDHWVPKSILPPNMDMRSVDNFVLACRECNRLKGDRLPEDWNGYLGPYRLIEGRGWVWEGSEPREADDE